MWWLVACHVCLQATNNMSPLASVPAAQSVVVRITDTCACTYEPNAYSNRRWCCGDMEHFDVSHFAFDKLAEYKWGVIGIKYRQGEPSTRGTDTPVIQASGF